MDARDGEVFGGFKKEESLSDPDAQRRLGPLRRSEPLFSPRDLRLEERGMGLKSEVLFLLRSRQTDSRTGPRTQVP